MNRCMDILYMQSKKINKLETKNTLLTLGIIGVYGFTKALINVDREHIKDLEKRVTELEFERDCLSKGEGDK